MPIQRELNLFKREPIAVHVAAVLTLLETTRRWWTRAELAERFGWTERDVRAVVEAAGAEVVKGQLGFRHISHCSPEEIKHASNQSISQGKHMIRYGISLRRRAHQLIGSAV